MVTRKLSGAEMLSTRREVGTERLVFSGREALDMDGGEICRLTDDFGRLDHRTLILRPRTSAMRQWAGAAIPSEAGTDPSPAEQFLDDLQTGTAKAGQYVSYISATIKWAEKWDQPLPAGVRRAGRNLRKIADTVGDGLEMFGTIVGYAQSMVKWEGWVRSLSDVAVRTLELRLDKPETLRAWLASVKRHRKKLAGLKKAVHESLTKAALRGSIVAGRASFMFSVVTAYVEVGFAALDAGTKNIKAYMRRLERGTRPELGRRPQIPAPPLFPGAWETAEEQLQQRRAKAEYERRICCRRKQETRRRQVIAEFNRRFPSIYRRKRGAMRRRILRDLKRGQRRWTLRSRAGTAVIPGWGAGRWWDCFMAANKESYFDRIAGRYIQPTKGRVTAREAASEISCFEMVKPRCRYFDDLYNTRLRALLRRRGVPQALAACGPT